MIAEGPDAVEEWLDGLSSSQLEAIFEFLFDVLGDDIFNGAYVIDGDSNHLFGVNGRYNFTETVIDGDYATMHHTTLEAFIEYIEDGALTDSSGNVLNFYRIAEMFIQAVGDATEDQLESLVDAADLGEELLGYNRLDKMTVSVKTNQYNSTGQLVRTHETERSNDAPNKTITTTTMYNYNKLGQIDSQKIIRHETGSITEIEALQQILEGLIGYVNGDALLDDLLEGSDDTIKKTIWQLILAGLLEGNDETSWEDINLSDYLKKDSDGNWKVDADADETLTAEMMEALQLKQWFSALDNLTQDGLKTLMEALGITYDAARVALSLVELRNKLKAGIDEYGSLEEYYRDDDALKAFAQSLSRAIDKQTVTITNFAYDRNGRQIAKYSRMTSTDSPALIEEKLHKYVYNSLGQVDSETITSHTYDIYGNDVDAFIAKIEDMSDEEFADWLMSLDKDTREEFFLTLAELGVSWYWVGDGSADIFELLEVATMSPEEVQEKYGDKYSWMENPWEWFRQQMINNAADLKDFVIAHADYFVENCGEGFYEYVQGCRRDEYSVEVKNYTYNSKGQQVAYSSIKQSNEDDTVTVVTHFVTYNRTGPESQRRGIQSQAC